MRRLVAVMIVIASTLCLAAYAKPRSETKIYRGAWFDINYPRSFTARGGMHSRTMLGDDKYDSAFFLSPDKKVEFYVYSPQWSGEPTDYQINPKREVLVAQRTKSWRGPKPLADQFRMRWVTVRARDRSYTRSSVDWVNETGGTRHVFGMKYRDQASYRKYRARYEAFKASLEQYAD